MLEQKNGVLFEDTLLVQEELEFLEFMECMIDPDEKLYLITWCPDPKHLPNADFYIQHNFNVKLIADYLKHCMCGVFCVEATQMGRPHYHGWYQVNTTREHHRIAVLKTMERFGQQLKITEARSYKEFCFTPKSNALYYYKKDVIDFKMTPNPIFAWTASTVNWDVLPLIDFFDPRLKIDKQVAERLSDREFYRQFYEDTIGHIK